MVLALTSAGSCLAILKKCYGVVEPTKTVISIHVSLCRYTFYLKYFFTDYGWTTTENFKSNLHSALAEFWLSICFVSLAQLNFEKKKKNEIIFSQFQHLSHTFVNRFVTTNSRYLSSTYFETHLALHIFR